MTTDNTKQKQLRFTRVAPNLQRSGGSSQAVSGVARVKDSGIAFVPWVSVPAMRTLQSGHQ